MFSDLQLANLNVMTLLTRRLRTQEAAIKAALHHLDDALPNIRGAVAKSTSKLCFAEQQNSSSDAINWARVEHLATLQCLQDLRALGATLITALRDVRAERKILHEDVATLHDVWNGLTGETLSLWPRLFSTWHSGDAQSVSIPPNSFQSNFIVPTPPKTPPQIATIQTIREETDTIRPLEQDTSNSTSPSSPPRVEHPPGLGLCHPSVTGRANDPMPREYRQSCPPAVKRRRLTACSTLLDGEDDELVDRKLELEVEEAEAMVFATLARKRTRVRGKRRRVDGISPAGPQETEVSQNDLYIQMEQSSEIFLL
ncbi:hypothetical protein BKA62DRAFT_760899 [Auriculariales sp. MPI-PUGE-AT-0066]|nr:hypothetical protein BKA62DRAFT_760899 [Auriculariales sp. MPI-PUGE-AT-0066]